MFNNFLKKHFEDHINSDRLEELKGETYILPFSTFCSRSVLNLVFTDYSLEKDSLDNITFKEFVSILSQKKPDEIKSSFIISMTDCLYKKI